jgi:hypothetical protein
MGTVIKRQDFPTVIEQTQQGVFILAPKVVVPVNAVVVNVGLLLGERLFNATIKNQSVSITHELDAILGEEHRDITLTNTDILFSPKYELDVIKLLLQLGRNQRFYLQWPGEITGEKLTYSEPGRFDFKEYNIKDYVDTYVILR